MKTFAALGVHGTSAVTCITAQNPQEVRAIEPCAPQMVRRQIEAVFEELPPVAVKTGMLFSRELVRVVIDFFKRGRRPPLIVDPVLIAASGARLLKTSAIGLLQGDLLPLAALVTPNLAKQKFSPRKKLARLRTCARLRVKFNRVTAVPRWSRADIWAVSRRPWIFFLTGEPN